MGYIELALQVRSILRDVAQRVAGGSFSVPQHGLDQLRQMLVMGPYQFLNAPPPEAQHLISEEEIGQVVTWNHQEAIEDANINRAVRLL
jgi:5,10-methenyltetrahydromethanopterin hydrogenase